MNRKLYDENQQYKERSCDQRQQIDNFHILFQENKQENERAINLLRKELDDVYQREAEQKRRMQQQFDCKHQENYQLIASLKDKLDDMKACEARLRDELNATRLELQQERNKNDLAEKKCRLVEKDSNLLKESYQLEKTDMESKHVELEKQIELIKKQAFVDAQKQEEKFFVERDEIKKQVNELEHKLEEVIKEKAQITCKYGQLADGNRELNSIIKNNEVFHEKKLEDTK